jgi:2-polyprenyl-6-methoxyphenol hydroxylase-like FAD-dependent oxidoreductase
MRRSRRRRVAEPVVGADGVHSAVRVRETIAVLLQQVVPWPSGCCRAWIAIPTTWRGRPSMATLGNGTLAASPKGKMPPSDATSQ